MPCTLSLLQVRELVPTLQVLDGESLVPKRRKRGKARQAAHTPDNKHERGSGEQTEGPKADAQRRGGAVVHEKLGGRQRGAKEGLAKRSASDVRKHQEEGKGAEALATKRGKQGEGEREGKRSAKDKHKTKAPKGNDSKQAKVADNGAKEGGEPRSRAKHAKKTGDGTALGDAEESSGRQASSTATTVDDSKDKDSAT